MRSRGIRPWPFLKPSQEVSLFVVVLPLKLKHFEIAAGVFGVCVLLIYRFIGLKGSFKAHQ
jgi:hypothetical protein